MRSDRGPLSQAKSICGAFFPFLGRSPRTRTSAYTASRRCSPRWSVVKTGASPELVLLAEYLVPLFTQLLLKLCCFFTEFLLDVFHFFRRLISHLDESRTTSGISLRSTSTYFPPSLRSDRHAARYLLEQLGLRGGEDPAALSGARYAAPRLPARSRLRRIFCCSTSRRTILTCPRSNGSRPNWRRGRRRSSSSAMTGGSSRHDMARPRQGAPSAAQF